MWVNGIYSEIERHVCGNEGKSIGRWLKNYEGRMKR
jgi:hypothetical protein